MMDGLLSRDLMDFESSSVVHSKNDAGGRLRVVGDSNSHSNEAVQIQR